jgi:hypothetical protein
MYITGCDLAAACNLLNPEDDGRKMKEDEGR